MVSNREEESSTQLPETTKTTSFLRHNSPLVQVILIGLVCFCCPGMFNALSSMGGGIYNILGPHLRTRGLNSVCYWGAQMLGSVGIGYVMDFSFERRRVRVLVGVLVVGVLGSVIWGGGLLNQLRYSSKDLPHKLDFKYSGSHFAGPFVLYFCFGLLDAMFQSLVYWVIGALADDSEIRI